MQYEPKNVNRFSGAHTHPMHKFASAWRAQSWSLTPEEEALYFRIRQYMDESGRSAPDADSEASRLLGVQIQKYQKLMASLVAKGTITRDFHPAIFVRPAASSHTCPKTIKRRVKAAYSHCEYCGQPADARQYMTVDRIVPGASGGRYEPSNVAGACMRCNTDKGTGEFVGPVRSLLVMEALHV